MAGSKANTLRLTLKPARATKTVSKSKTAATAPGGVRSGDELSDSFGVRAEETRLPRGRKTPALGLNLCKRAALSFSSHKVGKKLEMEQN